MKTEVSAGGIILRKRRGSWEVLVVQDMNNAWTFPKGLVEKAEDYSSAAVREIREEVGLTNLKLLGSLPVIRYTYSRNGLIRKSVHYFLFQQAGLQKPVSQIEEGLHEATWMTIEEATKLIGYEKTNKPLLRKAKQWTLNRRLT